MVRNSGNDAIHRSPVFQFQLTDFSEASCSMLSWAMPIAQSITITQAYILLKESQFLRRFNGVIHRLFVNCNNAVQIPSNFLT